MNLTNVYLMRDKRINGLSVSAMVSIGDYMAWFNTYGEENKLDEQRPQLKTRSATMIRRRLVEDLKQGAIIPPIVIGLSTDADLNAVNEQSVLAIIQDNLQFATVIDGMQRSNAIREALEQTPNIALDNMRVEIWVTNGTTSLIYRMLVLNTGQTPWDIKRQMEVVYKPLIIEARKRIEGIVLNEKFDQKRRRGGGEYPANSIVELLIAFSSRKEKVNTSDIVADEFTKLDITDMTGKREFADNFYRSLGLMVRFDKAVSRYQADGSEPDGTFKFTNGMDLFTQMPAKTGFIVALAQHIVGRAGSSDRTQEVQEQVMVQTERAFEMFENKLNQRDNDSLGRFLRFDVLNELIKGLPVKKIGDSQREFFRKGFATLIECNFDVEDLEVVWRAY